jgi:hypothetical protein
MMSPPLARQLGAEYTGRMHELIRLRDETREAIARHSGEPLT